MQSGQRSKSYLSNNSKTTEAKLTKLHRKIEHYDKVFHAQELGSYAQGQGSLAVFKVTARDQGHYKGPSGAFVTYCNISCCFFFLNKYYLTNYFDTILQHIDKLLYDKIMVGRLGFNGPLRQYFRLFWAMKIMAFSYV